MAEETMTSPHIEELSETLQRVQRRRRWGFGLRKFCRALVLVSVLIMGLVGVQRVFHFSITGRILLLGMLAAGSAALACRYLRTIKRHTVDAEGLARYVEARIPELEQRLLTSLE